jgi:hypothetical protein
MYKNAQIDDNGADTAGAYNRPRGRMEIMQVEL